MTRAVMTREEMLALMDIVCDSYETCTADAKGKCPLWIRDGHCVMCDPSDSTDAEIEHSYNLMFNKPTNPVAHPSHYNQGNIECIDAMVAAFGKEAVATFCHINAFKYLWRTEHKNGLQDIDKAIWYLNKYKELKASGE
jgi:hypothetical protein